VVWLCVDFLNKKTVFGIYIFCPIYIIYSSTVYSIIISSWHQNESLFSLITHSLFVIFVFFDIQTKWYVILCTLPFILMMSLFARLCLKQSRPITSRYVLDFYRVFLNLKWVYHIEDQPIRCLLLLAALTLK
jgi:prepilin signal peptidase PulO-like enzyme (type II secretory pathway)